jgi:selenide,water dikinase
MGHLAGKGPLPGGSCRNRDCCKPSVNFAPEIPEETQMLLFTPETSGGLLAAVPFDRLDQLTGLFSPERHPFWIADEMVEGKGIEVLK